MKLLTVVNQPYGAGSLFRSPTGSFVPPDKVSYPDGTVVSLEARPQNDQIYYFDHWEGALSGTNPIATITMDSDKTVIMVFKAWPVPIVPTYTLTTEVVGSGAVAPSGGVFQAGSGIILVALPSAQFVQWGGDASGTNPLLQLTMDSDKHVIATFGAVTPTPTPTPIPTPTPVPTPVPVPVTHKYSVGDTIAHANDNYTAKFTILAVGPSGHPLMYYMEGATGSPFYQAISTIDGDTGWKLVSPTPTPTPTPTPIPTPTPTPTPTAANLYGRAYDLNTGGNIAGVQVTLGGSPAATDLTGAYSFTNIQPGAYTIGFQKSGYLDASYSITLVSGDNQKNATLTPVTAPPPPPSTASLFGKVTDSSTGLGLAGVQVTLGSVPTATDAAGNYAFSGIQPGNYGLGFQKDGYQSASATVILTSGSNTKNVTLSPTTAPPPPPPPPPTLAGLLGKVTDSVSSLAISDVQVTLGEVSTATETGGLYAFAGLQAETYALSFKKAGYQSVFTTVTLKGGENTKNVSLISTTEVPPTIPPEEGKGISGKTIAIGAGILGGLAVLFGIAREKRK